jgi:hypothetical protein
VEAQPRRAEAQERQPEVAARPVPAAEPRAVELRVVARRRPAWRPVLPA